MRFHKGNQFVQIRRVSLIEVIPVILVVDEFRHWQADLVHEVVEGQVAERSGKQLLAEVWRQRQRHLGTVADIGAFPR